MLTGAIINSVIPTIPEMIINSKRDFINAVNGILLSIIQTDLSTPMRQMILKECSQNSFNNPAFGKLSVICCFISLGCALYKEQYNLNSNLNEEVNEVVRTVVEGVAADQLLNSQEFSYLVRDGKLYEDATSIVSLVVEKIKVADVRIRNYLTYLNQANNNRLMYDQPVVNNFNNNYNGYNNYSQPTQVGVYGQNTSNLVSGDKYSGRLGNNNKNYNEVTLSPSRYEQKAVEPPATIPKAMVNNTVIEKRKPSYTESDWSPSITNPYLTLITNDKTREFVNNNGSLVEVIKKGNKPMDRKAHTLLGDVQVDSEQRVKKVEDLSVKHVDALRIKDKDERSLKLKSYVHDHVELSDSLESSISYLRMLNLNNNDEDKSSYFRYEVVVFDTYPDKMDYNYMLENLSKCTSYVSVATQLSAYLDEIKLDRAKTDNEKVRALNYLSAINTRLTDFVNEFLTMGLGIKETMDSFVSDISSLESFLQTNFGPTHSGAFRDFEFNTIQNILKLPFKLDSINKQLKDENLTNIVVNYIAKSYTLTFVNVFLSELGLKDIKYNKPYALSRIETPMLYNVASSIYKDNDNLTKDPLNMEHLFITADDKRIVISMSYIARDLYVVKLLDK